MNLHTSQKFEKRGYMKKKRGGGDGWKSQIQRSITVKYKNKRLLDGSSTPEHCNAFIHSTDDSQC